MDRPRHARNVVDPAIKLTLRRVRLVVADGQEGARGAVHKVRRLPRQHLHRIRQLDHLRPLTTAQRVVLVSC